MHTHPLDERNHLMDWFMTNQLTKNKKTVALIESWENSLSALEKRVFWYYGSSMGNEFYSGLDWSL